MMLLIGIWISLTKKPMNPMIAKPMAVARAIFWNSKKLTGSFNRPLTLSTSSNRDILKNKSLFKWGLKWILKTLFQAFADPLHHLLWWCHRPAKAWNKGLKCNLRPKLNNLISNKEHKQLQKTPSTEHWRFLLCKMITVFFTYCMSHTVCHITHQY